MKKSNVIVFAILALVTAFLLYLWYYLGFNKVDNPVDVTLSAVWWVGIAAIIALIVRMERKRQRLVRTLYMSPTQLFNSEAGVVELASGQDAVEVMGHVLEGLRYGFKAQEQPKQEDFDYRFVVQTNVFKPAKKDAEGEGAASAESASEGDEPTWKGTVIKIDRENGNVETPFETVAELKQALA